jgi:alpha-tubulin suppressor-like RCC1 family protein
MVTGTVAAGAVHSLALTAGGTVYGWGVNGSGQVGDDSTTTRTSPVSVLTGAMAIAAGHQHSLAVKADGTAWAWGNATNGRLGNGGSSGLLDVPTQISSFTSVVAVAAGFTRSLALKSDGTVWGFGSNGSGEIGDGTTTQRTTPVQVVGLSGVVAIAAGESTSYALQADGAGGGWV